ncbi:MAG TPA: YtcA family lipoprotein [Opitutaceae bacterium]|nr:YtcA family lipoprotein [Opitutaceae bacterium]
MALLKHQKLWLLCVLFGGSACSRAPSIDIIGSFLPGWMFCLVAALIATGLLRQQLARLELEMSIPARFVFYVSVMAVLTCLFWAIAFS